MKSRDRVGKCIIIGRIGVGIRVDQGAGIWIGIGL